MDRRTFLRTGAATVGALALGPGFWQRALASPVVSGDDGPYGPLLPPDTNGIRLPAGFSSREIARSARPVASSNYVWHFDPDGGATFALDDGGWIYACNSEVAALGGVGAVQFAADGTIVGAHRVLLGTSSNCAGGPTPWGTWLSCEEHDEGHVWECDPRQLNANPTALRRALGTFKHEAVTVDPLRQCLYLTEDQPDGRFYRFVPAAYPDLSAGLLQAAIATPTSLDPSDPRWHVTWATIPRPNIAPGTTPTRQQLPATTAFNGGEGIWYDSGTVYFTTKGDNRVWSLDAATSELSLLYDDDLATPATLSGVDNVVVSSAGEVVVAEDGGDMQLVVFSADHGSFAPLLQVVGQDGSELTGPAFSPMGDRLYFSSQRGQGSEGLGITYEVRGPFNAGVFTGPVLRADGGGLLSAPIHEVVEPPVRGLSPAVGGVVHAVDRTLHALGL
jgi:secreted PhoX family phosphatase